jgi:uncharacterized membrane protein
VFSVLNVFSSPTETKKPFTTENTEKTRESGSPVTASAENIETAVARLFRGGEFDDLRQKNPGSEDPGYSNRAPGGRSVVARLFRGGGFSGPF